MHERKSVRTSTDGEGEVPSGILRAGGSPSIRRYIPGATMLQRYAQRAHTSRLTLSGRRPSVPNGDEWPFVFSAFAGSHHQDHSGDINLRIDFGSAHAVSTMLHFPSKLATNKIKDFTVGSG